MKSAFKLKPKLPTTLGAKFEKTAESHLNKAGLATLSRNYRCRTGEIDLIMEDGEFIVFVEVRYRSNNTHGDPFETITQKKQKRIIHAARHYLQRSPAIKNRPCRFDAIGIYPHNGRDVVDWIRDAFST